MTTEDWSDVITQAARLGAETLHFTGGEPTAHPNFTDLLRHAIHARLDIEVRTDLRHITRRQWTLFTHERVRLATSWYSDDPAQHDAITHQPGSHLRTRTNIVTALGLHIPLHVDIAEVLPDQRTNAAHDELLLLGVRVDRIRIARHRQPRHPAEPCVRCPTNHPAVLPNGDVTPCVNHQELVTGNVLRQPLAEIVNALTAHSTRSRRPNTKDP